MTTTKQKKIKKVTFHNKINSSFREIHVDGALGGITPRGYINVNFFAERFPIPKSTEFNVVENKKIGEKLGDSIDSKTGIIREYEFGIYMNIETAKNISNFLQDKIKEFETITKEKKHDSNSKQ
jgi:hypothetical protein